MGGLEFILIPLVMYGVWRAWKQARGEDASPKGHWHSRTDAMSEYMRETGQGVRFTRERLLVFAAILIVELSISGLIAYCAINKPDR
jgi:hypothetical protein